MSECPEYHVWRYDGVVFKVNKKPKPGTSAHDIEYFDAYFCQHCLARELKSLGIYGNTYGEIRFGARPARKEG